MSKINEIELARKGGPQTAVAAAMVLGWVLRKKRGLKEYGTG